MTLCLKQQHTVGNKLSEIGTICKQDRDAGNMSNQAFMRISIILKQITKCKFMESKIEEND